jgi:predicted aspartyl protease
LYTFDYDARYTPSIPVAEIKIGKVRATSSLILQAIIDSGADATVIPLHVLRALGARKSKRVWMNTMGVRQMVDLYPISLQMAAYERKVLLVVGSPDTEEAILGRDVLNHLIVTLNGLAGVAEISA